MKLKKAIRIAKDCGLQTFREAQANIEMHSMSLFRYADIEGELCELRLDLERISKEYGVEVEELLKWKIKEIENDI